MKLSSRVLDWPTFPNQHHVGSVADRSAAKPSGGRLAEKPCGGCRLPEQDSGDYLCLPAEPAMTPQMLRQVSNEAEVVSHGA